jgi:hypothetical protein
VQASDEAERAEHEQKFETYRKEMMYIFYYPKSEPYISLFPSAAHSEENQTRQKQLRAEAIARFEEEQPTEAFHHFCFNDKSKDSNSASEARPAVELLLKKPSKEEVKKQKKAHNKRNKSGEKPKHVPALVDQDDDEEMQDAKAESDKEEEEEQEEQDDFFL